MVGNCPEMLEKVNAVDQPANMREVSQVKGLQRVGQDSD